MSRLDYVRDLFRLRQIAEARSGGLNAARLEAEIDAAARERNSVLETVPRLLYELRGEETGHHAAATGRGEAPRFIDDAGGCDEVAFEDAPLVIVSPRQRTGHLAVRNTPLSPLLEEVFRRGATLLEDFTIHEALCGRVTALRGKLALEDIPLFPRRFSPGPFRLEVTLDTPRRTVARFRAIMEALDDLRREPGGILDLERIEALAAEAVDLRRLLGALSRYRRPEAARFGVEVPACVVRTARGLWYLLYAPERRENVLVHFGPPPFPEGGEPPCLLVLDGEQRERVLARLLELGLVVPAPLAELDRRVEALAALVRGEQRSGAAVLPAEEALAEMLVELERLRDGLARTRARARLLRSEAPGPLLGLAVAPSPACAPVAGALLPRLSWHRPTRRYHDTEGFVRRFQQADADARRDLLAALHGCLALGSPQNLAVNAWLRRHHRALCEEAGLSFAERP